MTRGWQHSDTDCPRMPFFGRRNGREWRCSCGRVWRFNRVRSALGHTEAWWTLVRTTQTKET